MLRNLYPASLSIEIFYITIHGIDTARATMACAKYSKARKPSLSTHQRMQIQETMLIQNDDRYFPGTWAFLPAPTLRGRDTIVSTSGSFWLDRNVSLLCNRFLCTKMTVIHRYKQNERKQKENQKRRPGI